MSDKREDGGPAFPVKAPDGFQYQGMSLRDWFAGMALQGIMVNVLSRTEDEQRRDVPQVADIAYATADSMLAARVKP